MNSARLAYRSTARVNVNRLGLGAWCMVHGAGSERNLCSRARF